MVDDASCHLSCYTSTHAGFYELSGTVTEIWRFKDNGVTTLFFWSHVIIRLAAVDFLWVVYSDHATI